MLHRNTINGAMRMQFWHSELNGWNEILKYIFRLWWVRTKQTQQVTVRAHAVGAMVPRSLPHCPLALPPWNSSRQSSSCREAFGRFLMAHPKCAFPCGDGSGKCLAPNRAGACCADLRWERGLWVRGSGSCVIWELHRSHWWQNEASWTWAAFPWAGKSIWIVQLVSVVRGAQLWHRKGHTGEGSSQETCAAPQDHLLWNQQRQSPHKSSPKLLCCWGCAPVFGKQQQQCCLPQHSPPCRWTGGKEPHKLWALLLLCVLLFWPLWVFLVGFCKHWDIDFSCSTPKHINIPSPLCRTRTWWSLCVPSNSGCSMVLWSPTFKSLCVLFLDPDLTSCCKTTTCSHKMFSL